VLLLMSATHRALPVSVRPGSLHPGIGVQGTEARLSAAAPDSGAPRRRYRRPLSGDSNHGVRAVVGCSFQPRL